jgi:hypothetical protein
MERRGFMKALLSILLLAGTITLGSTAAEQWIGGNVAHAQDSSACVQNCVNVRRWPESQCRQACAKKGKKSGR